MDTTLLVAGYAEESEDRDGAGLAALTWGADGFGDPVPLAGPAQSSWVLREPGGPWCYAVGEQPDGVVTAVRLPDRSGPAGGAGPTQGDTVRAGGDAPCHLAWHPGGYLVVSCYASGTVGLVRADGGALELLDALQLQGSGPHERQEGPHAHQATVLDPGPDAPDWLRGAPVVVCDLGGDQLAGLAVREGRLEQRWQTALPAGTGPRHLVADPGARTLHLVGELDCTVHTLRRTPTGWEHTGSVSTLPGGAPAEGSTASGIARIGDDLYVATRGADLLSHYRVGEAGSLRLTGTHPAPHWPRHVGALPDGSLVVAGERADLVQVWRRGPGGEPIGPSATLHWSRPACVAW